MAAVTPYEPLDYQQFNVFRPYQLPINDIFKAVSAQSQYWDEGAYKVKSIYENALNLTLSKEPNKQIRDKFVKESEAQLAKLSTMNLANASVQRMGIDIYKPLFQDRGIISDHAATEHIRKVNADAERARTQEHGKYYSQYNHQYALQGAKEFMDSGDRNAGESYLKQAKNYEDFYDYTEEYEKVKNNCPEDKTSSTLPYPGGYLKTESIKERSVSKAYNCLLSNLSGRAMRQLQIEGSVTYRSKDIKDFAQEVLESYEDQNGLYNKQRQQILGQMAAINSKDKRLTDQEKKDLYKKYNDEVARIDQSISENKAKIEKLTKGDVSDIYENFDSHASNLYVQKKLYKEAIGLAVRDYEIAYQGDPVQLQKMRQSFEQMMQSRRFAHDFSLRAMDQAFAIKMKQIDVFFKSPANQAAFTINSKGEIVANPNVSFLNQNLYSKPEDLMTGSEVYNQLVNQANRANEKKKDLDVSLFNQMITKAQQDPKFRGEILKAYGYSDLETFKNAVKNNDYKVGSTNFVETGFMSEYLKANKNDKNIVAYNQAQSLIKLDLDRTNMTLSIQEKAVLDRLKVGSIQELITQPGEEDNKVVSIGGKNFTGAEIKRALAGETVNGLTITSDKLKANNYLSQEERDRKRKAPVNAIPGPGEFFQSGLEWLGEQFGTEVTRRETNEKNNDFLSKYTIIVDGKRIDPRYGPSASQVGKWQGWGTLLTGTDNDKQADAVWAVRSIADVALQKIQNLNEVRNEVYRNIGANINQERYIQSFDKESYLPQQLQSALDNKNISVIGFTGDGDVIVNVPGADDNTEKAISDLGIAGGGVTRVEGTSNFRLDGTNYGIINQAVNDPYLRSIASTLSTVNNTKIHDETPVGGIVGDPIQVPIWNNAVGVSMNTELYIIKEGPQNSRYELWLKDGGTPLIQSRNSLEFINSFTDLPSRFIEPIGR